MNDLKATLAYLNDWDKDDVNIKSEIDMYTKEGIAHLVMKKIHNMSLSKCSTCQKTSHFKPGKSCPLSCIRCNRGACTNCYESDRDKLKSVSMFNKSIYFACETCASILAKENQIDEAYMKKSYGRKKVQAVDDIQTNPHEEEIVDLSNSVNSDPTDVLTDAIERLSVNDKEEQSETESEKPAEDITTENSNGKKDSPSSPKEEKMCRYYQQNKCNYGISGKGCNFLHPKMCQKLLSHGKSKYKGCIMDGKCKNFHPPMCRSSLSKRLCTNQKCEFMHVKGT